MNRQRYLSCLAAAGCLAFSPVCFGRGGSGGHGSASAGQSEGHSYGRSYVDPFSGPGYHHDAGNYDPVPYAYAPSPEQQAAAQAQVSDYFASVRKHRRHAVTHRCIAVATLRPTKSQREDYLRKRSESKAARAASSVKPEQLQCVMVFDTQAKQFVGSGCYVVEGLPPNGAVTKFDTLSAEFVGQETF